MDVGAWLRGLGLEESAEALAENGVDAALLPDLTNEDLKDFGAARLADRKQRVLLCLPPFLYLFTQNLLDSPPSDLLEYRVPKVWVTEHPRLSY